jgi:uncharacterized protein Smg (DUF494 family)
MKKILKIISEILKTSIEIQKDPREHRDEIVEELTKSGYNASTVEAVISFFFSKLRFQNAPIKKSIRVFHPLESSKLNMEAQGFLIDLLNNQMINYSDFEDILDLIREENKTIDLAELLRLMDYYLGYKSDEYNNEVQPASLYLN